MTTQNAPGERHIDAREFDPRQNQISRDRGLLDDDVSFMNEVAQGIIDRDRRRMRREFTRTVSFMVAVMCWYVAIMKVARQEANLTNATVSVQVR